MNVRVNDISLAAQVENSNWSVCVETGVVDCYSLHNH
jgi:hypothetical protein